MDTKQLERLEIRAKIIKAMAHPSRLLIVEEVAKQKRCVCELTDMVGADISTVSKHLTVLKEAGIVQDERQGTTIYYSLKCPCILDFFACVEKVWASTTSKQKKCGCGSCQK